MTQSQALAILDAGHSVLLTGPAGSGKTYVLREFIRQARDDGKHVAVTASTGLAATHLGGNTIHSWSGMGISDEVTKSMLRDMTKSRKDQITKADVLIIDEVSMLHDFRLDMIDQICRSVRETDTPFGGLQLVLCGDLYQLPPINRSDSKEGGFVVHADVWEALDPVVCYLEEQYRQDDDELLEILSAMRANDLRRRHAEALMKRQMQRTPFDELVTELYTRNINVDSVNNAKLDAMSGDEVRYEMTSSGKKGAVEALKKSCLAPEVLRLKKGAFVMFVKNSPEKKYVNGTLGEVISFEKDTELPIVKTKSGKEITVEQDSWEMRDGEKKIATLNQLPLRLAWAITVHKSQGMTLDGAHMDLSDAFVPGMGYVALSRVRNLASLSLAGINRTALTISEEAHNIDQSLRRASVRHAKKHQHLEKSYVEKKAKKKTKKPAKTAWSDKVAKMRETYPNAFKRWGELEDKLLLNMWAEGSSIKSLSKRLGRHEGSIKARLTKHFGDAINFSQK